MNNAYEKTLLIGLLKNPVKYVKIEVDESEIEDQFMTYWEKKKTAFESGLYSMVTMEKYHINYKNEQGILKELNASLLNDKNHVTAINLMNGHIETIYNACFDFVKNNDFSFKTDYSLYAKSEAELKAIIDPLIKKGMSYYIRSDKWNLKIELYTRYKIGLQFIGKLEHSIYVYNTFNNKQDDFRDHSFKKITLAGYKKAKRDIKKYKGQVEKLDSSISSLKFKYDLKDRF